MIDKSGSWLTAIAGNLLLASSTIYAQPGVDRASPLVVANDDVLGDMHWRELGPAVFSGRVTSIAAVESKPDTFFIGTASGGVWRTKNGGASFEPIFEQVGPMSIGAVSVCQSDPSVVWVGTGEPNNRQNSPFGAGVFKSTDGGDSWSAAMLADTQHIGQIAIDPRDCNVVYIAALGHLWGPNEERGLYKTSDGGRSWIRALFANRDTGAVDVKLDPQNPDTIYAAMYQRQRSPWGYNGGGPGSAIYKSSDRGNSWKKLLVGLPYADGGDVGRIGLAVYGKDPRVVYALVEARGGGLFRSNDHGETWVKTSDNDPVPAYFSKLFVDPNNSLRLYIASAPNTQPPPTFKRDAPISDAGDDLSGIDRSDDGGKTFTRVGGLVHLDFHAMWINPANSDHMIIGTDGGAYLSRDGGRIWDPLFTARSTQVNQVGYDMGRPYRVCAGFQDNSTWCTPIVSRDGGGIDNSHWVNIMGGDGFHAEPDPSDPNAVYVERQEGAIYRAHFDVEFPSIAPRQKGGDIHRSNWNSPFIVSAHEPTTVYFGAQFVFRSTNRGDSWTKISPDLTSGVDQTTLPTMGRLPKDQTVSRAFGTRWFPTITTISESPLDAKVLWVGTNDGNVQLSRDGGRTWENVSRHLRNVPGGMQISSIVASRKDTGRAYVAIDGHRSDVFKPYVLTTDDYGNSWRSVSGNLPVNTPVYVLQEDPRESDVLFAGTEFGAYVSFDRGLYWQRLRGGLPSVRVDDIRIHPREHDLIVGTHGRGIWVLDDITPLAQRARANAKDLYLFEIRPANWWREMPRGPRGTRDFVAPNPPPGALITYYLKDAAATSVQITVTDSTGSIVRKLEGPGHSGVNRANWDLRWPKLPNDVGWHDLQMGFYTPYHPFPTGIPPHVSPGTYTITVRAGTHEASERVDVDEDPAVAVPAADRAKHYRALMQGYSLFRTALQDGSQFRSLDNAVTEWKSAAGATIRKDLLRELAGFSAHIEALRQPIIGQAIQFKTMTMPMKYSPPALAGQVGETYFNLQTYNATPRIEDVTRLTELTAAVTDIHQKLEQVIEVELPALNAKIRNAGLPMVTIEHGAPGNEAIGGGAETD